MSPGDSAEGEPPPATRNVALLRGINPGEAKGADGRPARYQRSWAGRGGYLPAERNAVFASDRADWVALSDEIEKALADQADPLFDTG